MRLTPEKIRAARALLNWSQERLAGEAAIGIATIKRLERAEQGLVWKVTPVVENAVASALSRAGIILEPSPGDLSAGDIVACVALRKPQGS